MAKKTVKGGTTKIDVSGGVKSKILQTIKKEIGSGPSASPGTIHVKSNFIRGHGKTANPFIKSTESPKPKR